MFEIKTARTDELERIIKFYHTLIDDGENGKFGPKWQKDIYPSLEMIKTAIHNSELFIGEEGDRIAAAMILNCNYNSRNEAIIHALGVHPRFCSNRFERNMAKFAINYAIKKNQKTLYLDARNYYIQTARIYNNLGFELKNEDVYEYSLPPEITIQELSIDEISSVQKMVDESFKTNHPYFPQVFSYDDGESAEELSLRYYSHREGKSLYKLIAEDKIISCAVISIYKDNTAYVDLLSIDSKCQNRNLGYAAWVAIEKHFSQVKVWTLETPICLIKNVCFYVNKCDFSIIMVKDYNHDFRRFVFRKNIV